MKTILTNDIAEAAEFIKNGKTVAFPTETVYGLGANAFDPSAVKKIYKIKGRPSDNPLIVHLSSKKDIKLITDNITFFAKEIIDKFFPGPVTVILKKNELIPDEVTAGLDTVAVRIPSLKLSRDFINACGFPIAAPSANMSGSPSPTSFHHVLNDLNGLVSCILIGRETEYGLESTVIDCTTEPAQVLRPGIISLEDLKTIDKSIIFNESQDKVKSPGTKYKHYSPKAKVYIKTMEQTDRLKNTSISAYIGLDEPKAVFKKMLLCRNGYEYAKKLFTFFRECDRMKINVIIAEKIPEKGIGLAIMNRLKKAAAE